MPFKNLKLRTNQVTNPPMTKSTKSVTNKKNAKNENEVKGISKKEGVPKRVDKKRIGLFKKLLSDRIRNTYFSRKKDQYHLCLR